METRSGESPLSPEPSVPVDNSERWGRAPWALVGEWRVRLQYLDENNPRFHRLTPEFVQTTLAAFNDGYLSPGDACARLGVGRSRLCTLRTVSLVVGHRLADRALREASAAA